MFVVGIQHMFVMFGATVLVPILTGLDVAVALFASGVGTLLFHVLTRFPREDIVILLISGRRPPEVNEEGLEKLVKDQLLHHKGTHEQVADSEKCQSSLRVQLFELAKEKGIKNGDDVVIKTARGKMKAVAAVTRRFKPFDLGGKIVHQIGIPWHWGYEGRSCGGSANCLTPHVGDANTMIPEYKAFLCQVEKA